MLEGALAILEQSYANMWLQQCSTAFVDLKKKKSKIKNVEDL